MPGPGDSKQEKRSTNKASVWVHLLAVVCLVVIGGIVLKAQVQPVAQAALTQDAGQVEAKSTYESICAGCHGLDARGSERGPNLATKAEVAQKSDKELLEILKNGRTAAGMPAFASFGPSKLAALVAYLRTLQGQGGAEPLPGDPARGKILFFGKAKCGNCHMMSGQGGFLGPELSTYAARMNAEELRGRIVNPGKDFDARRGLVEVKLSNATTITGVVRNEDNFSLQLQTEDGAFHLLSKSEIASQRYTGHSAMPADYGTRLKAAELNDVVSYLLSASGSGNTRKAKSEPEDGDEE